MNHERKANMEGNASLNRSISGKARIKQVLAYSKEYIRHC